MSNLHYGPPEKFKLLRDAIPCIATYGRLFCYFQYSTLALAAQGEALALLMGVLPQPNPRFNSEDPQDRYLKKTLIFNTEDLEND